ncbi:MAG: iron-sulfur cluster assembly accessory protein [Caulobacterales bacterium 32-67-6]|nr:MAG: iron-sulfur cluster assembly accessory protein [Caulobacterales bacterium 32-67-6]
MTTLDLTLSASAAERLKAISQAQGKPIMLRIAVEGGGCSGFQYQLDLVDEISLVMLKGSEIDFVDELVGAEFKIRNPNAKSSCGCGVSFSI